jgi:hypothetical protein
MEQLSGILFNFGTADAYNLGEVLEARREAAKHDLKRFRLFLCLSETHSLRRTPKTYFCEVLRMKDARDVLRQKETDRARLQREIEALQLVIPLLTDDPQLPERKTESSTQQQGTGTDGPFFASIGETESQLWNTGKHSR